MGREDPLASMMFPFFFANPAEICVALCAFHVVAAFSLFNGSPAPRTMFDLLLVEHLNLTPCLLASLILVPFVCAVPTEVVLILTSQLCFGVDLSGDENTLSAVRVWTPFIQNVLFQLFHQYSLFPKFDLLV